MMRRGLIALFLCLVVLLGYRSPAHAQCSSFADNNKLTASQLNACLGKVNIHQPQFPIQPYMQGWVQGTLGPSGTPPLPVMLGNPNDTTSPFFGINVVGDTAIASETSGLSVMHTFGGATDSTNYCTTGTNQCSHFGLWVNLQQLLPTPSGKEFNTGIFSNVQLNAAAGSSNNQSGYAYAAQIADNVGGHYGITAAEFDVAVTAAGNQIKEGLGLASVPLAYGNDSQQGTNYSAGLGIWAGGTCSTGSGAGGSGCAGFNIGLSFGRSDSYLGVSPSGTLIQTTQGVGTSGNMSVANAINFGNLTVTQNYLNFGGKYAVNSLGSPLINTTFPASRMNDTGLTPTTGGSVRIASLGTGTYAWQVNTAAGNDFSAVNTGWSIDATGTMALPVEAPTSGANQPLCITTTTGRLYHATAGAC